MSNNPDSHTLVVLCHPRNDSYCGALAEAYAAGASDVGTVRTIRLADLTFDPVLHAADGTKQPLEPDLVDLQQAVQAADHVTFVFPVWWGAMPALAKGMVDRVFTPGWAFRNVGKALPLKLLKGRSARVIFTMDAPGWYYRTFMASTVHRATHTAWLGYVGFAPLRTTAIYELRTTTASQRSTWLQRVQRQGAQDAARHPRSNRTIVQQQTVSSP